MLVTFLRLLTSVIQTFIRNSYFFRISFLILLFKAYRIARFSISVLDSFRNYFSMCRSRISLRWSEIVRQVIIIRRHRSEHFTMTLDWRVILRSRSLFNRVVLSNVYFTRVNIILENLLGHQTSSHMVFHFTWSVRSKYERLGVRSSYVSFILCFFTVDWVWICLLYWLVNLKLLFCIVLVLKKLYIRHSVHSYNLKFSLVNNLVSVSKLLCRGLLDWYRGMTFSGIHVVSIRIFISRGCDFFNDMMVLIFVPVSD